MFHPCGWNMKFSKVIKSIFLVSVLSLSMQASYADVWNNENQWNEEWETQFSIWVEKEWDDEIFMRPDSILYNVKTDCADASYTMRMLFSYLNKLPFVIQNPNQPKMYLSNSIKDFDHLKNEKDRFLKFVDAINAMTDSGTLSNDTYPIQMDRKYFRAGVLYVSPNDHTYQVKSIDESGVPTVYSSTVPQEARYLSILNSFPFYVPGDMKNYRDGFRAFKQPHHYKMSSSLIPGFGLEQFEMGQMTKDDLFAFGDLVAKKIQTKSESPVGQMRRLLLNICSSVQLRAIHISWTEVKKIEKNIQCFNSADYENESTPSRDKRIVMMYQQLNSVYRSINEKPNDGYYNVADYIFSENSQSHPSMEKWCPISTHNEGSEKINLRSVWQAIERNQFVSDPHANFLQRWGFEDYEVKCSI